jgi:hypothetical protein
MLVRSAVRSTSSASCLVLRKPTNCDFLGSHRNVTLASGYLSSNSFSLPSSLMDSAWSLCGDASKARFRAAPDARAMGYK